MQPRENGVLELGIVLCLGQIQGFPELLPGLVRFSLASERNPEIVMRRGIIGIDGQGLPKMSDGFLRLSLAGEYYAQVVVSVSIIGMEPEDLLVILRRLIDFLLGRQYRC